MLTTDTDSLLTSGTNRLNGTLATFVDTTKVTKLEDLIIDTGNATLTKGDIVYIYGANVANGFYIIEKTVNGIAITAENTIISGITVGEGRVTKITNTNALVGNVMQLEEVEPIITRNSSSPSGTSSPQAYQAVAVFDISAQGSRDLSFDSLTVEKSGNNNPSTNITSFSLYNGSTKLSEAISTNSTVTFDGSSLMPLATQTITAGQTVTLTIKADTSSIKTGTSAGQTVTFTISIPGTSGPLVSTPNGLTWTYNKLNTSGSAHTSSTADNYPVYANTLSY